MLRLDTQNIHTSSPAALDSILNGLHSMIKSDSNMESLLKNMSFTSIHYYTLDIIVDLPNEALLCAWDSMPSEL